MQLLCNYYFVTVNNALHIVCLTNSMLKLFGLNEFGNNQIYYEQIKKDELIPSPWVLDDVIGPLVSEQNYLTCWQKQGRGEKILQAIDFFSIAKEK